MPRIALGLAYDGASWQGWQTQPHGVTVQDELERALAKFAGAPVPTICAGRTDTGVHAAMQVVHLDTALIRREESWVRGVNTFLPPSIGIQWAREVPDDFHARFSARARRYTYVLWQGRTRPTLWAGKVGWCHQPLDIDVMRQAAAALVGTHDFSSFRSSQCQAKHPVRTMLCVEIAAIGSFVVFTFEANAFLHHMIRNLMGALLQIGQRRQEPNWMLALLAARDRTQAAATFSPDGLYLSAITYESRFDLGDLDGAATLLAPFLSR
ncbi:tRNA pseudouridine(38-40) synthase TruA [Schauerella aestuarii]|uniref:tRNA pseudouridine(38-40) synthase TruA n=1 Tax=Schauerella aestuarii TaxID=2511204 RepID=UPI00136EB639|nr:tRNA pseudouridine(38-40) synthase TruA [Achromobacter aestuarii]MYZ45153.1 tRNA pseudouridine(38-40) synthase TruA [Achromobacter aestuarii]